MGVVDFWQSLAFAGITNILRGPFKDGQELFKGGFIVPFADREFLLVFPPHLRPGIQ